MRVLVIDDVDESRETLVRIFKKRGFTVDSARTERDALSGLIRPNVIIINSLFSEMSGFEVGEKLKDDPTTRDIPLIVLSSFSYPQGILRRVSGAGMEYIQKPCDLDYLIDESNKLCAIDTPPANKNPYH